MNSFVDAHTPSESPEASSSESSTGGDWESGELFKTNEHVEWPKQRTVTFSKQKLAIDKSNTSATATSLTSTTTSTANAKLSQHHFKSKTNSIKILNSNKDIVRKMRWLSNMRSDPDFRETFIKSVNIQPRQSIDSVEMDYYSTICDNQLSLGSPYKSPADMNKLLSGSRPSDFKPANQSPLNHQHKNRDRRPDSNDDAPHASAKPTNTDRNTVLVVAKPIESQSIGFKVVGNPSANASARHCCNEGAESSCSGTNRLQTDRSKRKDAKSPPRRDKSNSLNPRKIPFMKIKNDGKKNAAAKKLPNIDVCATLDSTASSACSSASSSPLALVPTANSTDSETLSAKSMSIDAGNESIKSNASAGAAKRNNRYPPFTFREFREELRSVMRQNSIKKF